MTQVQQSIQTADIGTVAIVLLLAAAFMFVYRSLSRRKGNAADPTEKAPTSPVQESAAPTRGISSELVAVIVAAVAAVEGVPASAVKIASLRASKEYGGFNTPIWGRVERLNRK